MVDGPLPRLVQYLPGVLVLALIVGGMLFGWLKGRGSSRGSVGTPLDGWLGDDGPHHRSDPAHYASDGGHYGDSGGHGH